MLYKGRYLCPKLKPILSARDKGVILQLKPERLIQYSHFSPLSGKPELPENYHTVTIQLAADGSRTAVSLSQDNNETEQEREHSEQNWKMMLDALKKLRKLTCFST